MRGLGRKAGLAGLLCGLFLFEVAVGASRAQSAETSAAPAAGETAKEGGLFGGCEPIGMTASGELVFPLECKKLVKKPAEAPVAAEDKAAVDDKTASTDAKPVEADHKPTAEAAAAAAAEPKHPAHADKPDAIRKAAAVDPTAVARPAAGKPSAAKMPPGKMASSKPTTAKVMVVAVKEPAPKAAQAESTKLANKDQGKATPMSAIKRMIVMAKPAGVAVPVAAKPQPDDKPRLRTAGMPYCVQFRSYNAATKSYLGYDGRIHACH